MRFNRAKFYEGFRKFEGELTQQQVNGVNFILDSMEKDPYLTNVSHAAYMFATVKPETAHTYQPIHEYGGYKYFVKRYGSQTKVGKGLGNDTPEEGALYAGVGLVQLTGESNFEKMEVALRKYYPEIVKEFEQRTGKKFDLTVGDQPNDNLDPQNAGDPAIAYAIMSYGMRTGLFTGRKLSDYDKVQGFDAKNARKIINGLDHAELIAGYYKRFLPILKQSLILGASTQTADNTATDITSPSDEPQQNQAPPTNVAEIEGVKPYNEVGLGKTLVNDGKALVPANFGLGTISEWLQQTAGLPEWVATLIPKLFIGVLILTAVWFIYRLVSYLTHTWRENERVKLLAQINSNPQTKDVELK